MEAKKIIESGLASLGIEAGSTRIKAVLIDPENNIIAKGEYDWENTLLEGDIWSYSLEDIHKGMKGCYSSLLKDVKNKYDTTITNLASLGISAMMHGYMALDKDDKQLVPFRTWRCTITGPASEELCDKLNFNIPLRWSVSHTYQAVLNKEHHVKDLAYVTTLSGYLHYLLTGNKVLGIGDASGMFPIDTIKKDYNQQMVDIFDGIVKEKGMPWGLRDIFPKVLCAGDDAGSLTPEGAAFLDESGNLKSGIRLCPPEGDAGTGMVATNSVRQRTGNVSAGTSIFGMAVLEKELSKPYRDLDIVTTPDGSSVAMIHANNGTSDLDAWVHIFGDFCKAMGVEADAGKLFTTLYNESLKGDKDCGKVLSYNFVSGEPVMGFEDGRPLVVRAKDAKFNLANFVRANLYTTMGVIKKGFDLMFQEENVSLDKIQGHGGLFKVKGVAQSYLAAATNVPVAVMDMAGEGGAYGIAVLASFMVNRKDGQELPDFLDENVFSNIKESILEPDPADVKGYDAFMKTYMDCLPVMAAAVKGM